MKSALKTVMIVVGLVLIGISVGAVVITTQMEDRICDRLAARLARDFGTEVSLEEVRLVPWRRGVELIGLTIANPPQFKEGHALRFERILVQPVLRTLFSDTLTLSRVVLEGAEVNLRYELGDGTNLGRLGRQAADRAATNPEGRHVRVRECRCEGAKVRLKANLLPTPAVPIKIAPFTMKELDEDRPVSTPKLAAVFVESLVLEIVTLKGLLRPVGNLLRKEADSF